VITLRHLHVESFKGLRSVDLTFPERGSILIAGHNEAGKSTLFEAVYVALYGKPLVGEEARPRQEDIIQHSQPRAVVELTFAVAGQELTVLREFVRDGQQRARLTIRRPDKDEVINRVTAVNERILQELGNLDGESLRNSCFVEQKALERLEDMSREERERAIQRLLGLERLTRLRDQFRFTSEQTRALQLAERRRDLACAQARARAASEEEQRLQERRDAAQIAGCLEQLDQLQKQEADYSEQLARLDKSEQDVRKRLEDIACMRQQLADCAQVEQHLADARRIRDSVNQLRRQLADLDRIEREQLPAARGCLDQIGKAVQAAADYAARAAVSDAAAASLTAARAGTRLPLFMGLAAALLLVLILSVRAWTVAALFLIGDVAAWIWYLRARQTVTQSKSKLEVARQRLTGAQAAMQALVQPLGLPDDQTALAVTQGKKQAEVQDMEQQLAGRQTLHEELQRYMADLAAELAATRQAIVQVLAAARAIGVSFPPAIQDGLPASDEAQPDADQLSTALSAVKQAIDGTLAARDEPGTQMQLEKLLHEKGRIEQKRDATQQQIVEQRQAISGALAARGLPQPADYTRAAVAGVWPLTAEVSPGDIDSLTNALNSAQQRRYAAEQQANQLIADLQLPSDTVLDVAECERHLAELIQERDICQQAREIVQEAGNRIVRRVLPVTERNMQLLLPQLTANRYWDVRLTAPEDDNGQPGAVDYRIRVWDSAAGRYVAKNLFSGGTRDQFSLALRLAFTLATLPQELGVAPGFIFLDEPLSAFDAQRAQALVELLTRGTIAKQFDQVVVISHHHAFDPRAFQYHVRLEDGELVKSDLP